MPRILVVALLLIAVAGCSPVRRSLHTIAHNDLSFVNEEVERYELGRRVRVMLNGRRFDRLEEIADSLERTDPRWPSGRKVLDSFYDGGFGMWKVEADAEEWETMLGRIREWRDARPQSLTARYALAEALIGRAWAARGGGYAATVSRKDWDRFGSDLREAGEVLQMIPERTASESYEWHSAMMKVLHGAGEDSLYRLVASSALSRFPDEPRFYIGVASHLMPRWYGEPGDWENFAEQETAKLPDSLADEFYARIVTDQSEFSTNVFRESERLSWARAKRGLLAWQRRWPASTQPVSACALLGWMAGDRELARESFASLGDTCDVEVWRSLPKYWAAREWAAAENQQ